MPAPRIRTARLTLSRLEPADAEAFHRYRADPRVFRYQPFLPADLAESQARIAGNAEEGFDPPGRWFQLGIRRSEDDTLLGDLGACIAGEDPRQAEFGITLAPEHHGQGYATEALTALLDHLFERPEMHRITASVDPANGPCLRLLERVGMRQEAHFRSSLWIRGEWVDDLVYAQLREDRAS